MSLRMPSAKDACDYRTALKAVMRANPELARSCAFGGAAAMKGDFAGALFLGLCANVAMVNTNMVPTERAGKREKRAAAQETW